MDALSSQSALAGYYAVELGATHLGRVLPKITTAAGAIGPAHVLVMGLGVAGLEAVATAHRLGAMVEGYDIRPDTEEQVLSLGATFVKTGVDAQGKGGYARELTVEEKTKVAAILTKHIQQADLIPKGLSAVEAAPLICAGLTTYKGIKVTEAKPGEWLAVSGCGGLGHLAIQYAKAMGLLVAAVDIDEAKLELASKLGADLGFNAKSCDPGIELKKETGGGAHGVLITAPSLIAFRQGIGMTRKRGTCALVGLPPGDFPIRLFDVVANCITIRGSFVGTRKDMAEALEFAAHAAR